MTVTYPCFFRLFKTRFRCRLVNPERALSFFSPGKQRPDLTFINFARQTMTLASAGGMDAQICDSINAGGTFAHLRLGLGFFHDIGISSPPLAPPPGKASEMPWPCLGRATEQVA
jgi:hypothetical protein